MPIVYRKDLDRVLKADEVDGNFLELSEIVENLVEKTASLDSSKISLTDENSLIIVPLEQFEQIVSVFNSIVLGSGLEIVRTSGVVVVGNDNKLTASNGSFVHGVSNVLESSLNCFALGGNNNFKNSYENYNLGSYNSFEAPTDKYSTGNVCFGMKNTIRHPDDNDSPWSGINVVFGMNNEITDSLNNVFGVGLKSLIGLIDTSSFDGSSMLANCPTVIGKFNSLDSDNGRIVFCIGNGTDDNNRSNLLKILDDGSIDLCYMQTSSINRPTQAVNKDYTDTQDAINLEVAKGYSEGTIGSTADRPTTDIYIGSFHFDEDLGHPIWYNGSDWVDSSGTVV